MDGKYSIFSLPGEFTMTHPRLHTNNYPKGRLGDAFRVWFACAQRLGVPPFDQCDLEALGSVISCRNTNACP